jgi:hypothetical protein
MEYAIGYVVVIFIAQAMAAVRTPHEDCQVVIVASVFWPFFLLLVAGTLAMDAIGWKFDVVHATKMFGFRKPTNPQVKGFGLTLFRLEFQMYKRM